jgi:hypothetical protein
MRDQFPKTKPAGFFLARRLFVVLASRYDPIRPEAWASSV